ncbi:hypothetical protein ACFS4T_10545 [Pseudomonas lini]
MSRVERSLSCHLTFPQGQIHRQPFSDLAQWNVPQGGQHEQLATLVRQAHAAEVA